MYSCHDIKHAQKINNNNWKTKTTITGNPLCFCYNLGKSGKTMGGSHALQKAVLFTSVMIFMM